MSQTLSGNPMLQIVTPRPFTALRGRGTRVQSADAAPKSAVYRFMWLSIFSSFFVCFEPAPVDALMILAALWSMASLSFGSFALRRANAGAIAMLMVFLALCMLSLFNAEQVDRGFYFLAVTFYLIIGWIVTLDLLARHGIGAARGLFNAYCIAASIAAVYGILEVLGIAPAINWDGQRAAALFKDPNVFGPFMVPASMYCMWKITRREKPLALWGIVFLVTFLAMVISFSRAAWANFGVAIFAFLVLAKQTLGVKSKHIIGAAVTVVVSFGALYASSSSFRDFFGERAHVTQTYDQYRFATQRKAIDAGLETVIGIGPGQCEYVFSYATHSLYMRSLAEYGPAGLTALLAFLGASTYRCVRGSMLALPERRPYYALAAASLMGLLANSFFIDTLHWRHLWFILAFAWWPYDACRSRASSTGQEL